MPMGDLRSHRLIVAKGLLFVLLAVLAGTLLVARHPEPVTAVLLLVVVWAAARACYFAFHVIEHWLDPGYRFSGLVSAIVWLWRRARS